jgi:hypothetical protein
MHRNVPIIFIHYGDSFYLKHVLKSAKKYNSKKNIILLGDDLNKKYKQFGVTHFSINDYLKSDDVKIFFKVFQYISGEKYVGGRKWTQFNFLKLFALKNFMLVNNLSNIWIFDSDVLITESLEIHEYKFINFDYSSQNELLMPQGMINNINFLIQFTSFINSKFQDDAFLSECISDFSQNPQFGLTYMRFFKEYNKVYQLNTLPIQTIFYKERFDRCLFEQFQDGMEMYDINPFQFRIKKVFFYPSGEIFTKAYGKNEFIKLITINLSWLPNHIINRIVNHANRFSGRKTVNYKFEKLELMHLNRNTCILWMRRIKGQLISFFKNICQFMQNPFI